MSGKKSKKSDSSPEQPEVDSDDQSAIRIREVTRPRLILALAGTYAVWLSLLVWLACRVT